ncbi:DUF6404 family protein [Spirochaeta dissipatitropha]
MKHKEKVQHMINHLESNGIKPFTAAPPLYRLAWKSGWNIRPPFFQSFISIIVFTGLCVGVLFGIIQLLLQSYSGTELIINSFQFGLIFGFGMALYYRFKARKLKLPEWCNYPETEQDD